MHPISKLADNGLVIQPNMPPISLSLTVTLNTRLSSSLVSFSFFLSHEYGTRAAVGKEKLES